MNKIKERYDRFVKTHGCVPKYAEAAVYFPREKQYVVGYMFSFVKYDANDWEDQFIFYYVDSLEDFMRLAVDGVEDFKIIPETVSFSDVII